MNYFFKIIFIASLALALSSCNELLVPGVPEVDEVPVKVTFSMTDRAVQTKSKVSGTENKVHTMQLVCFDANGQDLGIRNADVNPDDPPSGSFFDTGVLSGTVPPGTARIHFIANRNLSIPLPYSVGTAESVVMNSIELSTLWNDANHQEICYWGYHIENNAESMSAWLKPAEGSNHVVYMIRDRAKIVLNYEPNPDGSGLPDVLKIEWLIHNGRERGYIAPKSSDWAEWDDENNKYIYKYYGNSTVNGNTFIISTAGMHEYDSDRYSLWTSETENDENNFDVAYQKGSSTSMPQFLFDDNNTDLQPLKAILRVTYDDGSEDGNTVYHVLLLNDNDKEKYDIVRNNTYYINCKLLSPHISYYETLKDAIEGTEFMNADIEIDRSITEVNNDVYTLQILLPTETTATVLNTVGNHDLDFAFRTVEDISVSGSENPADFEIYWEDSQDFCTDPTLTYDSESKQFVIHTSVIEGKLTQKLQDEWIVVKHTASGLTRYIHVFVIDQFRYRIYPSLKAVSGSSTDYVLSFRIPPIEHESFIVDEGGNLIPDPEELVYPESLYPIDVKFTTNTLNAYGITQGTTNYGLFGVSVEGTSDLCVPANFESGYNNPISTTATTEITHWYYQQAFNYWDFWYTYSLKTYPTDGIVNIYLKDVRSNINYASIEDVGLFLYVEYFGKNYSVPVTN